MESGGTNPHVVVYVDSNCLDEGLDTRSPAFLAGDEECREASFIHLVNVDPLLPKQEVQTLDLHAHAATRTEYNRTNGSHVHANAHL